MFGTLEILAFPAGVNDSTRSKHCSGAQTEGLSVEIPNHQYILRLVSRILPKSYDRENMTQEIILECLEKSVNPTWTLIVHRCFDQLRRRTKELEVNEIKILAGQTSSTINETDNTDLINQIMSEAVLTPQEREVIVLKLYRDQTFVEIANSRGWHLHEAANTYNSAVRKLRSYCEEKGIKL